MTDTKTKTPAEVAGKPGSTQGLNCLVAKGTRIEGHFTSAENTRIDGEIKGEVRCDKKLVTGESSSIEGKIWAAEAVFEGRINGDIVVSGAAQLTATAHLTGTLTAKTLVVDEGAQLNGDFKIAG